MIREGFRISDLRCRHHRWAAACAVCKPIHSAKDQLYHFRWRYRNEQHDVHSKQQFQTLCQQRGLVPVVKEDVLKQGVPYKPAPKRVEVGLIHQAVAAARQTATPERIEQTWRRVTTPRR